jgi:Ca-activated chloride channel family protein
LEKRRIFTQEGSGLGLNVELSQTYIKANSPVKLYFLCNIHAERAVEKKAGPLNVALLIDASGSMGGEGKLENAKEAAKIFVDSLQEDYLSVYSFSDSLKEIVPWQVVSDKRRISRAIESIGLEGGTALFSSLRRARDDLTRNHGRGMTNRLIVITDGCPTHDEVMYYSDLEWRDYSERFALDTIERNASIVAIGVGSDYNEAILSTLGAKSGGEFKHVKAAGDLKGYLEKQLKSLKNTVGENSRLHMLATPGSELTAFSHRNVVREGDDIKIQIGGIEAGDMEVTGEIVLTPKPPGTFRIAKAFLEYDDPTSGVDNKQTSPVNVVATSTDQLDLMIKGRNEKVIQRVNVYKTGIELLDNIKTGDQSQITQKLAELTKRPGLDAETQRVYKDLLAAQQATGRLDLKELTSQTQQLTSGKKKEGE